MSRFAPDRPRGDPQLFRPHPAHFSHRGRNRASQHTIARRLTRDCAFRGDTVPAARTGRGVDRRRLGQDRGSQTPGGASGAAGAPRRAGVHRHADRGTVAGRATGQGREPCQHPHLPSAQADRDAEGQVLVTRAPGYQLVLAPGELDADRFAALVTGGRRALGGDTPERAAELLGEALGLWHGRPLADVAATALVAAEADRLEESRVGAEELFAEACLACGRYAEVVPRLRRLLADHPLREKLWALLMRALCGAGRQAEALEVYDQARKTISEELGVDPGAELRQLYQQILDADGEQAVVSLAIPGPPPAPPAPTPAQLPADISDFTGRS